VLCSWSFSSSCRNSLENKRTQATSVVESESNPSRVATFKWICAPSCKLNTGLMQTMQVLEDNNFIIILVTVFSMSAPTRGDMDGNWATFKWRDKHFHFPHFIDARKDRCSITNLNLKDITMLHNKQQWLFPFFHYSIFMYTAQHNNCGNNP